MKVEVKIPAVGESVHSAVIGAWQKSSGDYVNRDEVLVLLETDKASVEVPAEASGQLEIFTKEGEEVHVGAVVAMIDTSKKPQKSEKKQSAPRKKVEEIYEKNSSEPKSPSSQNIPSSKTSSSQMLTSLKQSPPLKNEVSFDPSQFSPAVRHQLMEKNLDPQKIQGTGKDNRIKKSDLQDIFEKPFSSSEEIRREKMTTIRKRIAERLVASQHATATLSTFNEVDMSNIIDLRKKYQEIFTKKFGLKLGFMGFFIKAVVQALKTYPRVGAQIDGDDLIYYRHCHISIAVSTEKGLIVPVIRYADQMNIVQLEKAVLHFANKTRQGKITPDDLMGGNFTISNGGVFGSLLSTPILNPPQSGILGMHKIEQRPVAFNEKIVIRPMMYLALSYDHRVIDGKESVGFLVKIKECIEDPTRLLLDV